MIRQLEVYRQEIATGEKRVADLRRQQASYESRLNTVATEWNTLQDDIVSMAKRTGASSVDPSPPPMPSTSDVKDPFLRRLFELAGGEAVVAGHKRRRDADDDGGANKKGAGANADEDGSDSEDEDGAAAKEGGLDKDAIRAVDAIKAKAAATKAALVAVLDAVDKNTAADAPSRMRELEAKGADATRELERLRERTAKQRKRNEEIGDALQDAQAECEQLRRSLASARAGAGHHEGLPPMATAAGARAAGAAAQAAAAAANTPGGGAVVATPATAIKTQGGIDLGTPALNGATPTQPDQDAVARLEADVAELKGRLSHQSKSLDDASAKEAKLIGDLRAAHDKLSDDTSVTRSKVYVALERRLNESREDSDRFRHTCSKLQREADAMRGDVRAARAEAAECGEQRRRTQLAEERFADAERRWRSAMDERDSVSDKLGAQAESAGRKKLNEERAAAVERLGEENKKLREECERARSLRGDLAAAEAAKKKAEADLAEARAAAESAKSALERVENGSAPAEGGAEELKRLLDAANARADAAEAKAAAAEEALAAKSEETDAFVSEVEEVGAAYEESQSETARLMQRLTERDGTEAKAIQDANAANNQCRRLRDELAGAEAAVAHERGVAQAAAQRCRDAEAARAEQTAELQRARDEAAQLAERMEEQTKTLRELRDASSSHREANEALTKRTEDLSGRSAKDAEAVVNAERKVSALEEQVAGLKRRGEKLLKRGGGADEYKEEIDAYKSMLRCSVCNDRPKASIITRCYHMFCQECVQVRLDNRDRKCPGCAQVFSASDVKSIYF